MSAAAGDQPDSELRDRQLGDDPADSASQHCAVGDDRPVGPTMPRLVLGMLLRRLRRARGIDLHQAGQAIDAGFGDLVRIEGGRLAARPGEIVGLLDLYEVADRGEREMLLALGRQACQPGWWQPFRELIPGWFEAYLGMEQAASLIRSFEVQFVPGLLQTADYARAVIRLGHPAAAEEEIERRVRLRMRRQYILGRRRPLQLWAVIDEAALRRPIGGRDTMCGQLEHLLSMSVLPHITVQILPFSAGGHSAAGGPVTVLRMPEPLLPDVIYLEQLISAMYLDRPAEVAYYLHMMNGLATEAAAPEATAEILSRIYQQL